MLLKNKVAIITGSNRGVGRQTAELLSKFGAKVVINCRHHDAEAEDVVSTIQQQGGEATYIKADTRHPESVDLLISQTLVLWNRIDILINNASEFLPPTTVQNAHWEYYEREINGCLKPAFYCSRAVLPTMKKNKYGRIINIGTTLINRPASGYGAHTAAKAALFGLTKTLARECAQDNITVNMISPGMVENNYIEQHKKDLTNLIKAKTPLQRLATTSDIANGILFFASDLSSSVTGSELSIDGGLSYLQGK